MRIAICDDEKQERKKTIETVKSVADDFSVNEFDCGEELLKSHSILPFDLIILDILMPGLNGIETAQKLRKTDKTTPVVFLSTSEEFGVLSYRVLAFDYLLKPIDKNLFKVCFERLSRKKKDDFSLTVTYLQTETKILLSNIQCLESNLRKVVFTLSGNKQIEIVGKLTDYEDYLTAHGFCRCHKSYLVNIKHIDAIENNTFYLTCGKAVKISRSFLQSAKKAYFDYVFSQKEY